MLGFLRRNLKVSNETTKMRAYFSSVRPGLEYSCTVWNPFFLEAIDKLEMVQRRAAQNQNQNSLLTLLVIRQIDNPSPGAVTGGN